MRIALALHPGTFNGCEYLYHALAAGIQFDCVFLIANDKDAAKAQRIQASRIAADYVPKDPFAMLQDRDLPVYFTSSLNNGGTLALIRKRSIDVIALGAPEFIKDETIAATRMGILNCHPSDIRTLRGCTNVEWALYKDLPIVISCHFVTSEVDAGPLVVQSQPIAIAGLDYRALRTNIMFAQAQTMVEGLKTVIANGPDARYPIPLKGEYQRVITPDLLAIAMAKLATQ